MKTLLTLTAIVAATPAFAASGPFVSFSNTNFIVLLGFLVFVGVLLYAKVPSMLGGMLDTRAQGISTELEEARALREEAQTILASYERKQREVQELSDAIVAQAKIDADTAAAKAKEDIKVSIARRLASAQDQIASAHAAAVRDVRNTAVTVAVAAAKDVIAQQMTAADANKLIDDAITDVGEKLH
jgi:F-type H+-transporting ATPase subunit b